MSEPDPLSTGVLMFYERTSFAAGLLRSIRTALYLLLLVGTAALSRAAPSVQPFAQDDSARSVPRRAQTLLVRGMTEASLGDHTEAIEYFESALDQAPKAPAVLQALANAHSAKGNFTTALFYARKARKYGEERPFYYRRLAELQQKAGTPEAALQTYRDLVDRFPENTSAYRALARLQSTLNRPEAALQTYDALLEQSGSPSVGVLRKRLSLYRQVGDSSGVRQTLKALVEARPNDARHRRQLARLYAERKRYEAALDLLAPLVAAFPSDQKLRSRVKQLSRKAGRTDVSLSSTTDESSAPQTGEASPVERARALYTEAIPVSSSADTTRLRKAEELLRQSLKRGPGSVDALVLLARVYGRRGEHRRAGQVLEQALEKNPRAPDRWARAAASYRRAGRFKKAVEVAREGLLLFPGRYALVRTAALSHLRLQHPEKALSRFQEALELSPDSTGAPQEALLWTGLGQARARLGRSEEAQAAFEKALSLDPDQPKVLHPYAAHLARQDKRLGEALKMAQRAVDQAPQNPEYLSTLGWVYFQRDNPQAARRHLRDALDTAPPSAQRLERYGDVQRALGNETKARRYWQKALDRAPNRDSLRRKLGLDPNT